MDVHDCVFMDVHDYRSSVFIVFLWMSMITAALFLVALHGRCRAPVKMLQISGGFLFGLVYHSGPMRIG
jgi:hypothetical protein